MSNHYIVALYIIILEWPLGPIPVVYIDTTGRVVSDLNNYIVYTHGLTDLCTYALRIMGSYYFLATFTILLVHHR